MKYLFESVIFILFTLTEINSTETHRRKRFFYNLSDDYESLDQKMDDVFDIKVRIYLIIKIFLFFLFFQPKKHHSKKNFLEESASNIENLFDQNIPMENSFDESFLSKEDTEKNKLLDNFNKNLNLDLKPENSIFQQNTPQGPIGRRLEFSHSPLNPRFRSFEVQKPKEVTYRNPEYVSNNYKTIKPKEPEEEEVFENDDTDDPMFLEGKKDTSPKTKLKVNLNLIIFNK